MRPLKFAGQFPGRWTRECTVVFLEVPDEKALHELWLSIALHDHVQFHEPDRGNELTAIAVNGDAQHLLSHLPLALREEVITDG